MEYQSLIDWLRFTLPTTKSIDELTTRYQLDTFPCNAVGFYNTAVEFKTQQGVMVGRADWHTLEPRQRVSFTFSGRDLDQWRETEWGIMSLFAWAVSQDAHFTRIDFAVDILGDNRADVEQLAASIEKRETKLKGKGYKVIRSVNRDVSGTTVYIGTRESDKFLRIYNKAAERGLADKQWTRIELEAKGDYARSLGPRLLSDGFGLAIDQINNAVNCPLEWWRDAIDAPEYARVKVDRTPGKRLKWQNTVLLGMTRDALLENAHYREQVRGALAEIDELVDKHQ